MTNSYIYFDHNATTPMLKGVQEELAKILSQPLNPSSQHGLGKQAKSLCDKARSNIAKMLNLDERYQIVFTSGGTEANNLALRGLMGFRVLTAATEHVSVLNVAGQALLVVDQDGLIDLEVLDKILCLEAVPTLVSVMAANNETGVLQPMAEIIKICKKHGAIVHTDACQIAGRLAFDVGGLDLDLVTISGHKFGAPSGIAALGRKTSLAFMAWALRQS
jgi:cysteine desulfurase